jgi:hypothetical protein
MIVIHLDKWNCTVYLSFKFLSILVIDIIMLRIFSKLKRDIIIQNRTDFMSPGI